MDTYMSNPIKSLEPYNLAGCTNECINIKAPAKFESLVVKAVPKKKEDTMSRYYGDDNYESDGSLTDTERQRRYFSDRIACMRFSAVTKLERQFGMRGDDAPETVTDALARLAAGKYVLRSDVTADQTVYNPLGYIVWKDPSIKKDPKGYAAAEAAYSAAEQAAQDQIVADVTTGLAQVKAMESWTYTAPATAS
jgi:hypothetical protein